MSTRWIPAATSAFLAIICAVLFAIEPGSLPGVRHRHVQWPAGSRCHCLLPPKGRGLRVSSGSDPDGDRRLEREVFAGYGQSWLGAPAGKYVVLVQWPDDSVSQAKATEENAKTKAAKAAEKIRARKLKLDHIPSDRLKGRYALADRPLLSAELKPETNNLPAFELQDGPSPAEEKKGRRPSKGTRGPRLSGLGSSSPQE